MKTLSKLHLKIVSRFSPSWPPLSFSMGPVDPSVENPDNNTEHYTCTRYNNTGTYT